MRFRDSRDRQFQRLVRARVTAYFEDHGLNPYANREVAFKAVLYITLTVGLYTLVISNRLAGSLLLASAIAFGVASILTAFNLAHDAAHNALTPSRRFNAIVYFLTFNLQGANAYLWRLRHIGSHHVFPNVPGGDADMDDNGLLRMSTATPWRPHYRYQHLYAPLLYMLFSLHWIFVYDIQFLAKRELANLRDIRHSWAEVACLITAKATYLTLALAAPMLRLDVPWWQVVAGFVIMHFAVSLVFVYALIGTHFSDETTFPQPEEDGSVEGSWATHQLAASLDYCPTSRLANFLLGGFNCHAAHHLFPEVCHIHYVAISKIVKQTALELGLTYHELPFLSMICSHFRFLKRLGRRPEPRPLGERDNEWTPPATACGQNGARIPQPVAHDNRAVEDPIPQAG
jgi:linoleoyl-CoA desaturase